MRRKRVETYFALYLCAIIAFLVVASERDKVEEELRNKNEKILAAFLRSAPVEPERDTLFWNVDADDRTGILRGEHQEFSTFVRIRDINASDSVSLSLSSLQYEKTYSTDHSIIHVLEYYPEPHSNQGVVLFPIRCAFRKTGSYSLSFIVRTNRIHELPNGSLQYNDFVFASNLISEQTRKAVEQSDTKFVVVVQDTSTPHPVPVDPIAVNVARNKIVSAVGFEETNEVFMNLRGTSPIMRVVYGSGNIERQVSATGEVHHIWRGQVHSKVDSVVIEARVNRGAGGKDIAKVSFLVMPNEPYLVKPAPTAVYAGEDFDMSIQVEGLSNTNSYAWSISMNGEKRASGNGALAHYAIPPHSEGNEISVAALYEGKIFRWVNKVTQQISNSTFNFKIQKPPVHIHFTDVNEVPATHVFSFEAFRYGRRKFEKPVSFQDVSVSIVNERGEEGSIILDMFQEGSFTFRLRDPNKFIRSSQNITITIHAAEALDQNVVRIAKAK